MKTRSANKNEPFWMLNDDRKSTREQDFDVHGHFIETYQSAANASCKPIKKHVCGWACSCFLTRLNFLIAGCLILFVAVVLDELTKSIGINKTLNSTLSRLNERAQATGSVIHDWFKQNYGCVLTIALLFLMFLFLQAHWDCVISNCDNK